MQVKKEEKKLKKYKIEEMQNHTRLDKAISELNSDLSRMMIQKLIEEEKILVNGKKEKASYKVKIGDEIEVQEIELKEVEIKPQDIPLDVLYEDQDIIVVNKPKGMVVHPAPGHYSGTLVNGLLYHCQGRLSGINGVLRPGIVHRIDMDTTGLIVACKNDYAHNFIGEQLKIHSSTRKYQAICYNNINEDEGTVNAPIGRHPVDRKKMAINYNNGRDAVTHYRVIKRFKKFTHIECRLETGRTHQIRVHMASINHPLLGDIIYGPKSCPYNLQGQTLHAGVLGFIHPGTKKYVEFEAPLPEYFTKLLSIME